MLLACGVALAATIDCGGGDCVGTSSGDTVNGDPAGNDAVYGGRGDDAVNRGDGDELLVGDKGNDTIRAATRGAT